MEITARIIEKSVSQRPFGAFEPFVSVNEKAVSSFYSEVLTALERIPGMAVIRELDHHGSGYASYISAFLFPRDGSSQHDYADYVETTGILLYMSRLAPIAVYAANSRTENKLNTGGSSGHITAANLGELPAGDWTVFSLVIADCLARFGVEILRREPILQPAPDGIAIPTLFDGPYYVFDTLFYWCD